MIPGTRTDRVRWRAGEPVSARKLNRMVDPENARRGVQPAHPLPMRPSARGGQTGRFILAKDANAYPDHLECRTPDSTAEEYEPVMVAKPYLLRRTPHDGETRGDIAYDYSTPTRRQASTPVFPRGFYQRIVPQYRIGDEIRATGNIRHGTGVVYNSVDIVWHEDNPDAREWALEYEPE